MKSSRWCRFALLAALACLPLNYVQSAGAEAKKDKEPGVWVERKDGGKLKLLIHDNNFELHFFDAQGEPANPEVRQAMLHYTSRIIRNRETLLLSPVERDEKQILTSPRFIRPPFQFDILLVLNADDAGNATETHHLVFIQEAPPVTDPHLLPPAAIGR
jgi:hypothetical protein